MEVQIVEEVGLSRVIIMIPVTREKTVITENMVDILGTSVYFFVCSQIQKYVQRCKQGIVFAPSLRSRFIEYISIDEPRPPSSG